MQNKAPEIGKIIHDAAQAYEFRGDNGDYTPTNTERCMLEDFGNSLVSDLCRAPEPPAVTEAMIELACAAYLGSLCDRVRGQHECNSTDMRAALEAAQPASQWRDIVTAPRDGTRILATGGGLEDRIDIAEYRPSVSAWATTEFTLDDRDNEPDGYNRPTLWMPLPPLPLTGAHRE